MAFTSSKGFTNDIFISYARVDDEATTGKGWITLFHEELKVALRKLLGRTVTIWRDSYLRGNEIFDDVIEKNIINSAIFITYTSPSYFESDYCKKELNCFYKYASEANTQFGLKVSDMSRIVNIRLYNIPPAEWAMECTGQTGYQFYDSDAGTPDDLIPPFDPQTPQFRSLVTSLASDLRKVLNHISKSETIKSHVFLANAAKSFKDLRETLTSELKEKNIGLFTLEPLPTTEEAHSSAVTNLLGNTCLSVHLFDGIPGRNIPGTSKLYSVSQAELILNSPTPQLIWVPKNLNLTADEVENDVELNFLTRVDRGDYQKKNLVFIRGNRSDISREILAHLKDLPPPDVPPDGHPVVLFDTHRDDLPKTPPMLKYLESIDVEVELVLQTEDPKKRLTELEKKLSEVNSFLLMIGSYPNMSLSRLESFLQLLQAKKLLLKARGIYIAYNTADHIDSWVTNNVDFYRDLNFIILDESRSKEFNPKSFEPFIKKIVPIKGAQV